MDTKASAFMKTLGKKKSEWILKGGLIEENNVSQIERKTHKTIAAINKLGCITFDSQCGESPDERAYLSMMMEKSRANKFMNSINMDSDIICIIVAHGDYNTDHRIPVTKEKIYGKNTATTNFPYILETSSINFEKKEVGIPTHLHKHISMIECIDPKWGRSCSKHLLPIILKHCK